MRIRTLGWLVLALATVARGDNNSELPFALANRAPLVAIYGLPMAQSGRLLGVGEQQWSMGITVANSFRIPPPKGNEAIYIDGETANARLGWRRGLSRRFELGLELPIVHHSGGFLDPLIDGFHSTFGFDRADRDLVPNGELYYQYARDGKLLLNMNEGGTGIGDAQLLAGVQLWQADDRWLAARLGVKAPTGDPDYLYGSGGWDSSAALHWADRASGARYRLNYELALGALYTSDGDVLPELRRNWMAYGTAMMGWQALRWMNLKLQIDGNTAAYDSSTREIGADSLQLTFGATFTATRRLAIDFAFSEDLEVDTAPDATWLLAFRFQH